MSSSRIRYEWKRKIDSYSSINERVLSLRFKTNRGYMTIFSVYGSEEGKPQETEKFYDIQSAIHKINKNDFLVVAGDLNARIGNKAVADIVGDNGKPILTIMVGTSQALQPLMA
jgi:hypothetical protein